MSHQCHAKGCDVEVPPKLLMCLRHWKMVPRLQQRAVWQQYRAGQETDKNPSAAYLAAATRAIAAVARREGIVELPLTGGGAAKPAAS